VVLNTEHVTTIAERSRTTVMLDSEVDRTVCRLFNNNNNRLWLRSSEVVLLFSVCVDGREDEDDVITLHYLRSCVLRRCDDTTSQIGM
jgi:hypothetical protein